MTGILTAIILACQVTGTDSRYGDSYDLVKNNQVACQKKLIICMDKKWEKRKLDASVALKECLLER